MKAHKTVHLAIPVAVGILSIVGGGDRLAQAQSEPDPSSPLGVNQQQNPQLTPVQRRTIYASVANDKSKTARVHFVPIVGADVPPMIELHTLPDQVLAENHAATSFEYTVEADKVVLVDPTRMRVVEVIGPSVLE
jgi:Protein of unknown function (DUF1236)